QEDRLRDDVVRRPGRDLGDRDDGRVEDIDPARHHRLQGDHDLGGDDDGIERRVRLRRVAAATADGNPDDVGRGHLRTGPEVDLAGRIAGRDVDGEGAGRALA